MNHMTLLRFNHFGLHSGNFIRFNLNQREHVIRAGTRAKAWGGLLSSEPGWTAHDETTAAKGRKRATSIIKIALESEQCSSCLQYPFEF